MLKSKLNISDAPVMMAGAAAPAPAASAPVEVFVVIDGLVIVMFHVEVCCVCYYRVSQKKRSLRIFTPLGATDASGDNSVGQGWWGDVG